MKYVSSGHGRLPLITLIAILSVSLTVNLPGLAISPVMGKLKDVFPHATQLQIQLLSVMPNLIIIPFILFSGKFANQRNQTGVLATGLGIFALSGILYFFADSMTALILISCLLGVGCGLVIPIAAGLIAEHFSGDARFRALGMESGVSNGMVILATLFVGWMADYGWHACFAAYLIPILPLLLLPYMGNRFVKAHSIPAKPQNQATATTAGSSHATQPPATPAADTSALTSTKRPWMTLMGLIALYTVMSYGVIVFSYYLPFTMKHYGFPTHAVGIATSMFYISATAGGFILPFYIKSLRYSSPFVAIAVSAAGIFLLGLFHTYPCYILGVFLIGFGYGIIQPIIYNKTTYIAPDSKSSTKFFSYVLIGNYIAIAAAPFIVEFFGYLLHDHSVNFPYYLNGTLLLLLLVIGLLRRHTYIWRVRVPSTPQ